MEQIVIYLLMVPKLLYLKQDSEINAIPFCLGSISKDLYLLVDNMKKT